jgi:hypothetical protein
MNEADPLGWFQWYCRYSMGRRMSDDLRQIKRWLGFSRHIGMLRYQSKGDHTKALAHRQALLQWARDPFADIDLPDQPIMAKIKKLV